MCIRDSLQVYSLSDKVSGETRTELREILIAILQLQIGALGENLSRRISDNLFSKKIDEVDIFDDLGELVQLNYRSTGVSGLEYLLDCKRTSPRTDEEVVLCFAQELLENIFASVLDYKSLIDSNWHYLYCPNAEWAKFCKISIFPVSYTHLGRAGRLVSLRAGVSHGPGAFPHGADARGRRGGFCRPQTVF